jgi:epoxyqueuosine reductase
MCGRRLHLRFRFAKVRPPLESAIANPVNGQTSQEACPWNQRFASALPDESPFQPREALAGKDTRSLARELLGMTQEAFSAAFRGSPMKRAKLRGLKRNAAVVLGNVGTTEDVTVLQHALDDPEALVREHAAWALARLHRRGGE